MPLSLELRRAEPTSVETSLLVALLGLTKTVPSELASLDEALGGALARTLSRADFRGGRDETLHLAGAARGPERVLLVGVPEKGDRALALRRAATLAGRSANKLGVDNLALVAPGLDPAGVESVATGLSVGAWDFADLRSPPPESERRKTLSRATILVDDVEGSRGSLAAAEAIGEGIALARRLAILPGNVCTPDYFAQTATELGERHGLPVTVLGRAEMEREQMGSFLCVAQGTPQDPKLIVIEYRAGPDDAAPIVLVGKGLCFDTGGISIKPADRMEFMKYDMCGAAGVLGAMEAIARLQLPINVVGAIGATTNMPSGTAVKPGDIVRSQLGKTIEIINTDAEGRLVLADVLSYVRRYRPAAVLDAATLTGACVIALGHTATGVFGADEALVDEVLAAGQRAAEPGWPLPVWDDYRELIKSDVADIKNTGGRGAGAITAAMFLKEFTEEYPWVHLDIAGTAYSENDLITIPRGPTGIPVGTFVEFVRGRVG